VLSLIIATNVTASAADTDKPNGQTSSDRPLRHGPRIGFSEGLGRISVNKKWGFINEQGRVVIAPRFDNEWSFSEGMAPVMLGHKWGFIDTAGKMVIPPVSLAGSEFSEGVACVAVDRRWQYLDKTGKLAFPETYELPGAFSEGWAPVIVAGKQHYIDHQGHIVLMPEVYRSGAFHEGLAVFWDRPQRAFGFIDRKGAQVIPARFTTSGNWFPLGFQEGRALVCDHEGKFGFIDRKGNMVLPAEYDYASNVSEGLARVGFHRSGFGFIDHAGQYVIRPHFERASDFSNGLAAVRSQEENGYIDHTGKMRIHLGRKDTLYDFEGGFAIVVRPDLTWGYIDKTGNWIWKSTK
jgi:hypothetical protein